MSNKIKESFDEIHAEDELKLKTKNFVHNQIKNSVEYKKRSYKKFVYVAAVFILFVIIGYGGKTLYFTPTVTISIDINPSVELGINRFDKVIEIESYNDDGEILANSLDIKYMNYDDAIEEVLNNNIVIDLTSNDEMLTISVIGENNRQCGRIYSQIENYASQSENTYCYFAEESQVSAAHEMGLSYGKYRALLQLQEIDPSITAEDIKDMTMREIHDMISNNSNEDENQCFQNGYGRKNGMRWKN